MTVTSPTLWYDNYVSQVSNLMVISSANTAFGIMLPGMIDYAEQRLYREVDFLRTQDTVTSLVCSSGNRNLDLSSSNFYFITVDSISIITPVTATSSNGTRNPVQAVSREFIDSIYPSGQTVTGIPAYYAMSTDTEIVFGPAPDAAYATEAFGEVRPAPLTSSNSSTYLTQYCPDLFIAASMVFASNYLQDAEAAKRWEEQYNLLVKSAHVEQLRAAMQSQGWTSQEPNPIATPPRV